MWILSLVSWGSLACGGLLPDGLSPPDDLRLPSSATSLDPAAIGEIEAELGDWRPSGLAAEPWRDALSAWSCAAATGQVGRPTLAVIDFTRPSDSARMWVVDLQAKQVIRRIRVSHGSGSGERYATSFSNVEGSHATSLGLYRAAETYQGKHGYSLKLDGLEPSNAAARSRHVVIHAADYVTDRFVARHGRAGRSWGCPAVDPEISSDLINDLTRGGLVYAWHSDADWRASSPLLSCSAG